MVATYTCFCYCSQPKSQPRPRDACGPPSAPSETCPRDVAGTRVNRDVERSHVVNRSNESAPVAVGPRSRSRCASVIQRLLATPAGLDGPICLRVCSRGLATLFVCLWAGVAESGTITVAWDANTE